MAPAPASDGKALKQLGRYELLELLGRGGMAEVYKARLPGALGFDKMVAVKRILPEARSNPDFVEMFVREARLCSRMMHPNLIQVFEFNATDDELFLAMELVEGSDLRRMITAHKGLGKGIPLEFVSCLALGVLRGLDGAHRLTDEKGQPLHVVHRDLSPANVLLSYEGAIKVADFGVAHQGGRADADNTIKGKLQYMAPEQLMTAEVDFRVDVFAAGCVLYEMLCGAPVYPSGQTPEVLKRVSQGAYVPIERMMPDVLPELAAVVRKALAAKREERYPDCAAFANDLLRLIQAGKLPCASNEEFGLYLQVLLPKQPFRAELVHTPSPEDVAAPILTGTFVSGSEVTAVPAEATATLPGRAVRPPPPPLELDFGGSDLDSQAAPRLPTPPGGSVVSIPVPTPPRGMASASAARPPTPPRSGSSTTAAARPPSPPAQRAVAASAPASARPPSGSLSELDQMLRAYLEEAEPSGAGGAPKVEVNKPERRWFKWRK